MADRGFPAAGMSGILAAEDVGFILPCRNTGSVACALEAYAASRRDKV